MFILYIHSEGRAVSALEWGFMVNFCNMIIIMNIEVGSITACAGETSFTKGIYIYGKF